MATYIYHEEKGWLTYAKAFVPKPYTDSHMNINERIFYDHLPEHFMWNKKPFHIGKKLRNMIHEALFFDLSDAVKVRDYLREIHNDDRFEAINYISGNKENNYVWDKS